MACPYAPWYVNSADIAMCNLLMYVSGVPHLTLKDDEYNGYVIPAKTMVIANIWCVHCCCDNLIQVTDISL